MEGFVVNIDADKMSVKLIASNNIINPISSEEDLLQYLKKKNVIRGISSKEILRAFVELPELTENKVYTVALGKKPINGKNGEIVFKIDVSGHTRYIGSNDNEDDGNIDYRSSMVISTVLPNDCICNITSPTIGSDGFNIEGKLLPATDGKEAHLVLGEGVQFNSDRTKVFAVNEGRPVFLDKKLYVSSVYEVHGDVCFETGNIVFDGHIYVSGMVEDGFSVEGNSVEIRGSVGSSLIKSQGELIITGGVNGRSSGTIQCNGNATIKYLNDVNIEVDGDLTVTKEIVNSEVKCLGKIKASRIIGGMTTALKGIEVKVAGSEIGTPTLFEAGVNYRVKLLDKALANLSWQIESLISPFVSNLGDSLYFKRVTPKIKDRIVEAYEDFIAIKKGYLQIVSNKEFISHDESMYPISEVVVMKLMHPDVSIITSLCHKDFIYEFAGPIKLVENLKYKSIDVINYKQNEVKNDNLLFNKQNTNPYKINITGNVEKVRFDNSSRIIYTKSGLSEIDRKFKTMIKGQGFSVCVFDDRHTKRMTIINNFKRAGIENILEARDSFSAIEIIKDFEKKKLVFVCSFHIGVEEGLKLVASFLQNAENHYGIILVKSINPKLAVAVSKINTLAIFDENVDINIIIQQIKDFGFIFGKK